MEALQLTTKSPYQILNWNLEVNCALILIRIANECICFGHGILVPSSILLRFYDSPFQVYVTWWPVNQHKHYRQKSQLLCWFLTVCFLMCCQCMTCHTFFMVRPAGTHLLLVDDVHTCCVPQSDSWEEPATVRQTRWWYYSTHPTWSDLSRSPNSKPLPSPTRLCSSFYSSIGRQRRFP